MAEVVTAIAAVALHWLDFGGIENVDAAQTSNDLHDIEYALLGSM